ncbi:DUF6265 family protein [Aurantiacibacter sp. MUD61]|uniref:DUF6265 family protein n=1 Tax=Aurantiacibacter sp. MUD61 TaxID=3009083 RepID=UPI0022F10B4D|nr:DUF6265 family protein [Aurantiacibacter sp. MUD61]
MRYTLFALTLFLLPFCAAQVEAQETRIAPEGHVPPAATLDDVAFLTGQWSGDGIQGQPAHESWLPPTGNTMVGIFVQQDGDGGLMFTEHMYIREVDGSLQVSLKHFNGDLTGWEERDEMLTWRLVSTEPCAAYFSGLTYRCANGENTDDGILVAVRMRSEGDEISELVFNFAPMADEAAARGNPCADTATTIDTNECYMGVLEAAEERRAEYLAAAQARYPNDAELQQDIAAANAAYSEYVDAECGAVYDYWISGSIRNVMALTCQIRLADQATHNIWRNWLTYMDSSPPILPEPEPTL